MNIIVYNNQYFIYNDYGQFRKTTNINRGGLLVIENDKMKHLGYNFYIFPKTATSNNSSVIILDTSTNLTTTPSVEFRT